MMPSFRCRCMIALVVFDIFLDLQHAKALQPILPFLGSRSDTDSTTHHQLASSTKADVLSSRRRLLVDTGMVTFVSIGLLPAISAFADSNNMDAADVLLKVKVTLGAKSNGLQDAFVGGNSALYITARPNVIDNIPKAVLDGSRGKAPPVLIVRVPIASTVNERSSVQPESLFPMEVSLTKSDVTLEGGASSNDYWWQGSTLVVSVRLDSDGIAATRDPADLVGRSVVSSGNTDIVSVELQGRGAAGKFATRKSTSA